MWTVICPAQLPPGQRWRYVEMSHVACLWWSVWPFPGEQLQSNLAERNTICVWIFYSPPPAFIHLVCLMIHIWVHVERWSLSQQDPLSHREMQYWCLIGYLTWPKIIWDHNRCNQWLFLLVNTLHYNTLHCITWHDIMPGFISARVFMPWNITQIVNVW